MIINKILEENDFLPDTTGDYFGEKILSNVGVDHDFIITVDGAGDPNFGRGGSATARDMLRLGIMLLNNGENHDGNEVLPQEAVNYIFDGSDDSRESYVPDGGSFNKLSHFYGLYNGDCDAETCEKLGW